MTDEDVVLLRQRIHKLNDMVQVHESKLAQHDIMIKSITDTIELVRGQMSTREQLQHAMDGFGKALENAVIQMTLKLQMVHNDLDPMKRGIYWAITLIIGTLIIAAMALILKKP